MLAIGGNFYPRPPRGGRRQPEGDRRHHEAISIHALREEGDLASPGHIVVTLGFLSTPSARRATRLPAAPDDSIVISIHALREEGDRSRSAAHFYSGRFLSTPSARRATHPDGQMAESQGISIHALREEGDPSQSRRLPRRRYFYPRPPRGGRLPGTLLHFQ